MREQQGRRSGLAVGETVDGDLGPASEEPALGARCGAMKVIKIAVRDVDVLGQQEVVQIRPRIPQNLQGSLKRWIQVGERRLAVLRLWFAVVVNQQALELLTRTAGWYGDCAGQLARGGGWLSRRGERPAGRREETRKEQGGNQEP